MKLCAGTTSGDVGSGGKGLHEGISPFSSLKLSL